MRGRDRSDTIKCELPIIWATFSLSSVTLLSVMRQRAIKLYFKSVSFEWMKWNISIYSLILPWPQEPLAWPRRLDHSKTPLGLFLCSYSSSGQTAHKTPQTSCYLKLNLAIQNFVCANFDLKKRYTCSLGDLSRKLSAFHTVDKNDHAGLNLIFKGLTISEQIETTNTISRW